MKSTVRKSRNPASTWRRRLARFPADEQGDEGVNKVLIIALIAIPIVILLIAFGNDIVGWFKDKWNELSGQEVNSAP